MVKQPPIPEEEAVSYSLETLNQAVPKRKPIQDIQTFQNEPKWYRNSRNSRNSRNWFAQVHWFFLELGPHPGSSGSSVERCGEVELVMNDNGSCQPWTAMSPRDWRFFVKALAHQRLLTQQILQEVTQVAIKVRQGSTWDVLGKHGSGSNGSTVWHCVNL